MKTQECILICGGSGLVGTYLANYLQKKGYKLIIFTRKQADSLSRKNSIIYEHWAPEQGYINPDILNKADIVINLAGSNIASHAWTKKRKKAIFNSRILSTRLLHQSLAALNVRPRLFINASAIGFYPSKLSHRIAPYTNKENEDSQKSQKTRYDTDPFNACFSESDKPGKGFVPELVHHWENEAQQIAKLEIPTLIFRIGLVLSQNGGILSSLLKVHNLYMSSAVGSGKQKMNWIHIHDLARLFLKVIESKAKGWTGIYNAVSPHFVSNAEFSSTIARILGKNVHVPRAPTAIVKAMLGSRSILALEGCGVSAQKLLKSGFQFQYPKLDAALEDLLDSQSPP